MRSKITEKATGISLKLPKKTTEMRPKITEKPTGIRLKVPNKTGSSQVSAISKARKYSKNNYWKHLEKLFSKKNLKFFFRKKVFF